MKQRQILHLNGWTGALALGLCLGTAAITAQAQNNPGNGPNGAGGRNNPQRADYRNLTQEQRQQLQDQVREFTRSATIRLMLENAGFTDKALQDTVVVFAAAQDKAVQPLRNQQRQLTQTLFDQATTTTQVATLLNDFHAAVEDEVARRKTALTDLDAKTNYSKQPRLAGVLTTMGLLGDEMEVAGQANVLDGGNGGRGGPGGGPGGFGGPGGGPGGGFGGPGGGGPGGGFGGPGGGFGGPGGGFGGPGGGFGGPGGGGQGGQQGNNRQATAPANDTRNG